MIRQRSLRGKEYRCVFETATEQRRNPQNLIVYNLVVNLVVVVVVSRTRLR